jgi:hypothetical protein
MNAFEAAPTHGREAKLRAELETLVHVDTFLPSFLLRITVAV